MQMVNTLVITILWREPMYEYKCKIRKVVDGDTVDVDIDLGFGVWLRKQRVRLVGIETPQLSKYATKLTSCIFYCFDG